MNNLLQLLTSSMTQQSSINAAEKKTGIKGVSILTILSYALPLILKFMTSNASNQKGAQSLLGALTQHTSNRAMPDQIADADLEDGTKIIRHIFGDQTDSTVNDIARSTNTSAADVTSVLSAMAPALLSSLSAATTATANAQKKQNAGIDLSDGLDVSDLVGIFQATTNANGLGGLLGSFLGGQPQQTQNANDGSALLSSLLSFMK